MSFDTVTQIVTVQKIGELSSLHNSLSDRVEMFVPPDHPKARSEFRLDDLLRALPGTRERFAEVDGHDPRLLQGSTTVGVEVPRVDGSKVWVHVAAIELMIAHALSTWSRYDPVEWEGRLSGLRDGMSYIYLAFMDQVLVDFPLWTLRILTDQDYWFGPHPFDESNVNRLLGNLFTP